MCALAFMCDTDCDSEGEGDKDGGVSTASIITPMLFMSNLLVPVVPVLVVPVPVGDDKEKSAVLLDALESRGSFSSCADCVKEF
jgi:hypothetical protein